jgi:hypothetical protein
VIAADGFRCETEIFVAANKEPAQETLTIFSGAVVYDFLLGKEEASEVTVYDLGRGQISLLDKRRSLRTTITTAQLLEFTAAYKTVKPESDLFKFCIQPVLEATFAEDTDTLTLASKQLTYRVTCIKPEQAGAEGRYRQFADWSAQLNAMRPGNLPPFPRLELNQALFNRSLLPQEIERTVTTVHLTGRRTESIRSRHNFNWALSGRDRELMEKVDDQLVQFKSASVEDYLGLGKKMARR